MPGGSVEIPAWLAGYAGGDDAESAHLEKLLELYGGTDSPLDRTTHCHVTGSGIVVHLPTRRVLLRWHARQHAWLQVGGHGDPGESDPFEVAMREAREETGLYDLAPWPSSGRPAILHVVSCSVSAAAAEPAHEHLDVRYLLTTSSPDTVFAENRLAPLRWSELDVAIELACDNLKESLERVRLLLDRPERQR